MGRDEITTQQIVAILRDENWVADVKNAKIKAELQWELSRRVKGEVKRWTYSPIVEANKPKLAAR